MYSRTSMARTLMACIPCLTRTCPWVPIVPYTRLLFSVGVFMLLFSSSIFSDQWSLKVGNEKNSMKMLTAEVSYMRLGSLEFVQVYIETNPGWLELPLTDTNFYGSSLFEPLKFYCIFRTYNFRLCS